VNERVVETEFVFDRHAASDVSVAYAILVPQRRARIERALVFRRRACPEQTGK
jgi:hypothetical protein